jgi:hypothetical protein
VEVEVEEVVGFFSCCLLMKSFILSMIWRDILKSKFLFLLVLGGTSPACHCVPSGEDVEGGEGRGGVEEGFVEEAASEGGEVAGGVGFAPSKISTYAFGKNPIFPK